MDETHLTANEARILRSLRYRDAAMAELPPPRLDALVLAGTHQDPTKLINGRNKALLPLEGKPVVCHVVEAVCAAPSVDRVFVVGPVEELGRALADLRASTDRVHLVPQRGNFLENGLAAYMAALPGQVRPPRAADFAQDVLARADLELVAKSRLTAWVVECLQALAVRLVLTGAVTARWDSTERSGGPQETTIERALTLPEYGELIQQRLNLIADRHLLPPGLGVESVDRLLRRLSLLHFGVARISFRRADLVRQLAFREALMDWPALIVTGDVPLLTPEVIERFVSDCDLRRCDLAYGVADAEALAPYASSPGGPGIDRPYVALREKLLRIANIAIARPLRLGRLTEVQRGYQLRKAKQWGTILGLLAFSLQLPGGGRALKYVSRFQTLAVLLRHRRLPRTYRWLRNKTGVRDLEYLLGILLAGRVLLVPTPTGGVSIDIDELSDYEVLRKNFRLWRQEELARLSPPPRTRMDNGSSQ
ncbi:MAG: NTP transferase domain-containing protein [Candidatus Schekmanbacteria bacterium]|nr:NTP transferase domain-containing protein [Candidatus Schekmanbacteria bacterium]